MGNILTSNLKDQSTGKGYRCKVYFYDWDVGEGERRGSLQSDDELLTLGERIGNSQIIRTISIQQHDLENSYLNFLNVGPLKQKFVHQFIVIRTRERQGTNQYFWSLEKNGDGVTVQRSIYLTNVLCKYKNKPRQKVEEICRHTFPAHRVASSYQKTMHHVFNYLRFSDAVTKEYSLFSANCIKFAKQLYDSFTTN